MLKGVLKRAIAMILALSMIISFVPEIALPVSAATVDAATLGVPYLSITYQTQTDNQYVKSDAGYSNGQFSTGVISSGDKVCAQHTTDITFTNSMSSAAVLTFTYQLSNPGSVKIGSDSEVTSTTATTKTVEISRGGTLKLTLTSKDQDNTNHTTLSISNISLVPTSTTKQVTVAPNDPSLGTVSGGGSFVYQSTVTISATPTGTGKFMGWYDSSNKLISSSATYSFQLNGDVNYTARFISTAHEAYILETGTSYPTLKEALAQAEANGGGTVSLLRNVTLTESLTVPSGVTLLVPCRDNDSYPAADSYGGVNPDGTTATQINTLEVAPYRELTIGSGTKLTVQGRVIVNAVTGWVGDGAANRAHNISGGYGRVNIASGGSIDVVSGGEYRSFGITLGAGTITAKNGGLVCDLMIFPNWRGGTFMSNAYSKEVFPYNEYYMHNIQTALTIEYGGTLRAMAKINARESLLSSTSVFHYAELDYVGSGNALFRLAEGASMTRTYSYLTDEAGNPIYNTEILTKYYVTKVPYYTETYTFTGGMSIYGNSMNVPGIGFPLTVSSTDYEAFPIPHGMHLIFEDGDYNIDYALKFMPGSELTLQNGANLYINKTKNSRGGNVDMAVYSVDNYVDPGYVTPPNELMYPSTFPAAKITIKDTSALYNLGYFGGTIYTENGNIYNRTDSYTSNMKAEATDPIWVVAPAEIQCTDNQTLTVVRNYSFALDIHRPMYGWRIDPNHQNIIWDDSLAKAVAAAEALNADDFTEETWENLQTVLEAAKVFCGGDMDDPTAKAEFDAQVQAVTDAINALEYTVTLVYGNGSANCEITMTYGETAYRDLPADPSRTGYTFGGWYNGDTQVMDKDGNLLAAPTKGHHTLTAQWTANTYTVTFNAGEGSVTPGSATVTYDGSYGTLPTPTREGHRFDGWYLNGNKIESATKVTTASNHTLTAQWTIMQYTALFQYVQDGETYRSFTQNYGTTVTLPETNPERRGYTFTGWFYLNSENTATKQEGSFTMPAGGKTLFAGWNLNSYDITYDVTVPAGSVAEYDVENDVSLPTPTKQGYTFAGWKITANDANERVGEIITEIQKGDLIGNLSLEAQWTPAANKYTVEYYTMGTDGVYSKTDTVTVTEGVKTEQDVSVTPDAREGFTVDTQNSILSGTVAAEGNTVLKVYYSRNQYTVTWNVDGTKTSVEYAYGAAIELPTAPTKLGHTFAGWEGYTADMTMPANDVEFTATWTANSYTITFMPNGGSGNMAPQTFTYGDGATLSDNQFTRVGHHFVGWSTTTDENGKVEAIDDELVKMAINGKITLYAVWEINTYHVVYDANGGDGETAGQRFEHGGSVAVQPNGFTRTGYSFTGWQGSDGKHYNAGAQIVAGETWSYGYTLTLTAQWTANTYTVTFDANGGTACDSITVTFDSEYGELPTPTKTGYDFGGWYLNDTKVESATTVTEAGHHTLTAKWIPAANEYTVEYYTMDTNGDYILSDTQTINGVVTEQAVSVTPEELEGFELDEESSVLSGTIAADGKTVLKVYYSRNRYTVTWDVDGVRSTEDYYYGAAVTVKEDPSKEGHTFAGWTPEISATMGAKDVTYTAAWTVNSYTVTWIVDSVETEETYAYGEEIIKPADPTKPGYTFTGWGAEVPADMPAEHLTFTAQWTANTDTPYTVEHYWMDVNGEYPVNANSTENKEGTTDTQITVSAHADVPTGFSVDMERSVDVTISSDGTTVLTIYYSRNQYSITFYSDEGEPMYLYTAYYGAEVEPLFVSSNPGYTHTGWVDGAGNAITFPIPMPATNDMKAVATWTPIIYTIDYDLDGGVVAAENPGTYTIESETFTLVNPTKTGYTFLGWTWEGQTEPVETVTIERGSLENRSYTANWKIKQYTITFVLGNGEANIVKTQDYGTEVTAPADPTRVGYIFDVWDAEIPATMPAGDMTINATWKPVVYYVVFEANGGTNAMSKQPFTYDEAQQLIKNQFHREGYAFAGWNTKADGNGTAYSDMQQVCNLSDAANGEVVLYAQWNAGEVNYKVEHYWMELDGTYRETTEDQETKSGTTATEVPAEDHQKIQAGFTMDAEKSQKVTISGDGTTVLKIYYARNQYTATWNVDGDETGKSYYYGETISRKEAPTKEGHTFAGWQGYVDNMTMPASNVTFTATWTVNSYDLSWDLNGGTASNEYTHNGNIPYGTAITAPIVTREGYEFAGWNMVVPNTMPAEALAFTAQWTANIYTVTFHANGGTVATDSKEVTFDGTYGELPIPTKIGYDFGGWYTDDKTFADQVTAETKYTAAEGTTLYAKWTPVIYTIGYDLAGGAVNGTNPGTFTIESGEITLVNPIREGYTFAGWTGTGLEEATLTVVIPTGSVENRAYTANWTVNQYTITFVLNNGEQNIVLTRDYGTDVTAPENPSKTGYAFAGWDKDVPATMGAEDLTITAQWVPAENRYTVEYYEMGIDGTYGDPRTESIDSGIKTEDLITLDPTAPTGFALDTENSVLSGTVAADGKTVLKVYYSRNRYTVTWNVDGNKTEETYYYEQPIAEKAAPSKVGYGFTGWTAYTSGMTMPAENLTFTAAWTAKRYSVAFDANGGTVNPISMTVTFDSAYGALPTPVRPGYDFAGWYTAAEGGTRVTAATVVSSEDPHTLYARWTPGTTTYTIIHWQQNVADDDYTEINRQTIENAVTEATTAAEAWIFTGFAPQEIRQETIAGDGTTVVNIYYDRNVHTLTWNANGGILSGGYTSGQVRYGTPITVPEVSRNGYTFFNWGSAVVPTMPDQDLSYTADWTLIPYTITYVGMDGAQNGNPVGYNVETETFALTEPTKTGYTFLGWTWEDRTEPVKDVTIAKGSTGDRTYTAHWEANTYTVVFHANGGEGTMENQSLVWDDAKKPLSANTYTRKGYTFLGWALTENATAAVYADGAEVVNLVSEGAVALYAVWSLDTYSIGYTLNGGTVATPNPESYTVETDSFTLTNPTRTGYTFLGWTVNGGTEKLTEVTIDQGSIGSLRFEAHWQINTYTITFYSNGGAAVDAISREYLGTVLAADVVKPQREGYTFVAWYLDEALTKPVTYPVTMTADLDFYAKWTINQYTITFMDTGDTVMDPITQDYGTAVTAPADPVRKGYTFVGWDVEIPETMPAQNVTVTALWTINQYTITFMDTGDTVMDPITQDYGTPVTAPANPVRKGYTFAGWDVEIPATMGAEDITITALWTINQYSVTFDPNGGAPINPIKQNYLTQVGALPDAVRAGYRFDGWFYSDGTAVTLPITLEENVTVVAHWTSYLKLLMAIDPADFAGAEDGGEDRAVLEQAREYFNLMKLDGEQLAKYQGSEKPYVSHWDALEAEIREVALLELEQSIEGKETLDRVNELLTDNGKAAATLDADPVTNYVDIWIEDPQREAAEFLTIPFLTTLLNNRDIWSIHFPAMEGESDNGTPLTPYGSGVETLDQLNLMIRVAYATINTPEITKTGEKLTYNQFFTWLQQNRDITVGVLDGKGVTIVVNAKTPEGVEFSTTYVLAFYNRAHDVTWDVDGVTTTETYDYKATIVKPADPVKEGFTFTGWEGYTDGMTMGKENVTFKATWTINTYNVTWNVDGKTTVVPYEYGAVIRLPEAPVKEGHSFTGWSGYTEGMTMPAGDLTFTAVWDVLEFTVTFNSDGGTEVESVTQDYGTQINDPTAPEKTGYTFGGWYNGDTKVEFPLTMPAGGLELKAKWTINQYTITFVLGNGQDNITITQDYNTVVAEPGDPIREGHTFAGWDKEIPAYMPAEDVTITAQWTVNQYKVTFVLGNGQDDIIRTLNYGDTIVLPDTPEKAGHSFAGWDGYAEGMAVPAENVTITAQWTPNQYTVTLDAAGGTVEPEQLTVTYGQPYGLPTPVREGYTFDGWFHNGAPVSANVDITADATFVAQWTLGNPYNISYDLAGGNWTEGTSPRVQYTVETSSFTLPTPTREGYTFAGWTGTDLTQPTKEVTVAKGSTGDRSYTATWAINSYDVTWNVDGAETVVTYEYGAVIQLPAAPAKEGHTFTGWTGYTDGMTMPAGDLTFTAAWSVNQYTITFVQGNGQPDIVKTQNYGTAVTAPADPARAGYTFGGWDQTVPGTMPAEDLVITAQWTINQYTITFVQGNGQPDIVLTQDYGTAVNAPADPVREGYTFSGWDKAVPGTMPAENVVITAKWTVNRYTITFVQGNGEADILVKQDYGTAVTAPADPVREGYTFLGWDREIPATVPAGDITITARWEINVYTITFDTAGGTAVEAIQDVYGAPITAPSDPTREGYTFDGWDVEIPETMPAGDMTITAKWKVNTYTLTYLVDGEVYKTLKLNYGAVVVPELEPTKTGYTFSGWDQTAMLMPAHDVQISGTFTANTYTVHFNANYPAAPAVADMTITFDSAYGTLPVVERTGYTFLGWTLDGVTVTAQTLVKTAGEHTLVAQWSPNTYKVTLVLDGGECNVTEITVTYDGTYEELPVPTREGYEFLGWFNGENQVLNSAKVTITADQTLTARWKATGNTPYTVEHYRQALDGTYELVLTENLTGAADTLTQAQQQSFTGFHVNGSLGTASGVIQPDGSLVLKLYYDRNSYEVVWNVAGKQIRETYLYGQTLNVPDPAWAEDIHARYDFTGWDQELPETVAESATYNAQYSLYYEATIGSVTYRTLALALENAKPGETVRLARDVTVTENLTVPENVLLLIPCKDDDNGYDLKYEGRLKFNYDAPNANGVASLYRTLTVSEGATLTIQGTLLLNSVSGRTTSGEQDITGGYGRMILNGEVIVADGGLLDCFGFITGTGKVTVQNGGTASDMYIVRHWRGGTQAYNMYVEEIYPMNEYDCRNIEVDVVVHYGGSYEGLVKMYAGNEYNYTRYPQVHVTNGLIRLTSENGYVVRSYADGVETYKLYGGGEIANSALTILGVDLTTADFIYPIDGDIRYELYGGRYDIVNDYKFLPGSAVLVGSDASLHVAAGVTVVFYQEFNDVDNTGNTEYPAGRAPAVLTVRSGASFTNAGTFAGHIYTESPDIWIGVDPVWDAVTKEANGLAASLPDGVEAYVELQHTLSMERPGHTWHYGADLSIVWDGYADYSAVQQAIASIPKDLDYYTPESVAAIQPAVDAVIYNLPYERQAEVDAMAIPILEAVAGLVPRTITVILDANGGTVEPGSITATCTMAIGTLPTPTREYHTFQGWFDGDGNRVTARTVIWSKTDITITAKWRVNVADYSGVVRARNEIPSDMSMYTAESAAAVHAASAAVVTGLSAQYQAEVDAMAQAILDAIDNLTYIVTLDANGGDVEPNTLEKIRKETDYAGLPTPTRRGYRFDGWFNAAGEQITEASVPAQGHHTLTARWTLMPADYTAVDAALALVPADLTIYSDETVAALQNAINSVVRDLMGDRQDEVDAMAQAILDAINGLELYTILVTFDPNGGTVDVPSKSVAYTQAYGELPVPEYPGHRFDGWFNAGGEQVTAETVAVTKEDVTLTARWTEIPADYSAVDAALALVPADLTIYSDETAAAVRAAVDAVIRDLLVNRQADVDAMAQAILDAVSGLELRTITVTLDPNGGTVDSVTITVTCTKTFGALPVPVYPGFDFAGWYTADGVRVDAATVVVSREDLTLTARWVENMADYTIVENAKAQIPADLSIYSDETVAALNAAVDAVDYTLTVDRQDEVDAMAQAILDAIAGLKLYPVRVTFDAAGGTVDVNTMTVEYTQAYGELPVPVRSGHRFDGWFNAAGAQVTAETIVDSKENVTLTARWTPIPADYSAVENAKAQIPADLSIYTDETVMALNAAVDAVDYTLTVDRQDEVDAMAQAILDAIAALKKKTVTVTTDDGNGNTTENEIVFGEPIGELPEPEDDCKIFLGWYNAEGEPVTEDTVIDSLEDMILTAKWQDICLEVSEDGYTMTVHYHGETDEISYVDVTVDPGVTVDNMTLRIPAALPTTRDAAQAPLIHVHIPGGFKLRLEIPMDTMHYGNVAMIDSGIEAQSDVSEMTIINETIVTDYGVALAVTSAMDIRVVENSLSFPDVPEGFWAKKNVDYLTARKYLYGKNDGTYAPSETILRKTVVMMLWRFAGRPEPQSLESPFSDVQDPTDVYYKAILWAYETGVTVGYNDGTFGPDKVILRQHLAAMMFRYADLFGYALPTSDNGRVEDFTDYDQIGASFRDDVQWALDRGLMLGHKDGRYNPVGETPRDQMSAVFFRFLQAYHQVMYEADPE